MDYFFFFSLSLGRQTGRSEDLKLYLRTFRPPNVKLHSILSCPRLKIQQGIRTLKQKCSATMVALCPCQVWWSWAHAPWRPWELSGSCAPPPKNCMAKNS